MSEAPKSTDLVKVAQTDGMLALLVAAAKNADAIATVKPDYVQTEQARACLQELLAALEEPPVDAVKLNLLKSLFWAACTEAGTSRPRDRRGDLVDEPVGGGMTESPSRWK